MEAVRFFQVDVLPENPVENAYYALRISAFKYRQYLSDSSGNLREQGTFYDNEIKNIEGDVTLEEEDHLCLLSSSSGSFTNVIIPNTAEIPINFMTVVERSGTGIVQINPDQDVLLKSAGDNDFIENNPFVISDSPGAVYLRKVDTYKWIIYGNID